MTKKHQTINYRWYQWCHFWLVVRAVMSLLTAQEELIELEAWAKRKGLRHVRAYYSRVLIDVERRLWQYRIRYVFSPKVAQMGLYIMRHLLGKPRYRKGYAAKFRGM